MLLRLRSFLKRSKSSSSNLDISPSSSTTTSPDPCPPITTPTTDSTDNNVASTPDLHPTSPTGASLDDTKPHLLPSPSIPEPVHIRDNLPYDTPFAKQEANPITSESPLLTTPPPHVAANESIPVEKDIWAQDEEELSRTSSDQLPWLSPVSKHPAQEHSPSASPASLSTHSSVPSLLFDHGFEIMQRKIWVKRPGASATLVAVKDDDLVDTVRDMILQKYANSLGRSIDSPDITLKIVSREQANKNIPIERVLGPEESIGRTLDLYYAGGQTIDEALVIDIPQRRTPKPSPRVGNHHPIPYHPYFLDDQHRPTEAAREYFPPMAVTSPHIGSHPQHPSQQTSQHMHNAMSLLAAGQIPPLPSPGGHSSRRRPKYVRQHTSSPTIMHSHQANSNGKTGLL